MKYLYKLILATLLLTSTFQSKAQWQNNLWPGTQMLMLKNVNGNLFAYSDVKIDSGFLYMSMDSGANWQRADSAALIYARIADMTYDSAHSVYIAVGLGGQNGVFISTDGLNWTQPSGNLWSGDGVAYINGQLVLSSSNGGIAISTNGGQNWNVSDNGIFGPDYEHYVTRIGDTLYVSGQGTQVCAVSGDYGATWVSRNDSETSFINCYYQHDSIVYAGLAYYGAAYYQNGYWHSFSEGLPGGIVLDTILEGNIWALTGAGDTLFCGADSIGVWMNTGGTWQEFNCGLPAQTTVYKLVTIGNTLFAGTRNNGVWSYNLSAACVATGLPVVNNNYTAEVFPTVTDGLVNIRSSEIPETIHVLNSEGQLVQVFDGGSTSINIGNCARGLYFVQLIWPDGQTVVKKVVKTL